MNRTQFLELLEKKLDVEVGRYKVSYSDSGDEYYAEFTDDPHSEFVFDTAEEAWDWYTFHYMEELENKKISVSHGQVLRTTFFEALNRIVEFSEGLESVEVYTDIQVLKEVFTKIPDELNWDLEVIQLFDRRELTKVLVNVIED